MLFFFLREKTLITAILSYPVKYLRVDLEDFSRNGMGFREFLV